MLMRRTISMLSLFSDTCSYMLSYAFWGSLAQMAYGICQWDGVLQQAGCLELGEHLNTIGDHGHDLGDHTVVGAAGHIGVEFLVGRAVVLPGADLVLHLLTQLAQSVLFGFLNALGGQLENAFGIDVAQLVDVAHCGINKINVDTDIRLACTRNLLELFENEPELRESASIGRLYKDLKKNPKNFDPRNYVASIMDTITLGTVPDAHVQKVVDCMKDGVTESIAPLLVQLPQEPPDRGCDLRADGRAL